MFYIFDMDTACRHSLDINLHAKGVADLKNEIHHKCAADPHNQFLMIFGGTMLKDNAILVEFPGAGTESNPVLLFRKIKAKEEFVLARPDTTYRLAAAKLQQSIEGVYSVQATHRLDRTSAIIDEIYSNSNKLVAGLFSLVRDQQLQQQGWFALMAHVDDIFILFRNIYDPFRETFEAFVKSEDENYALLGSIPELLDKTSRLPVCHRILERIGQLDLTSSRATAVRGSGRRSRTGSESSLCSAPGERAIHRTGSRELTQSVTDKAVRKRRENDGEKDALPEMDEYNPGSREQLPGSAEKAAFRKKRESDCEKDALQELDEALGEDDNSCEYDVSLLHWIKLRTDVDFQGYCETCRNSLDKMSSTVYYNKVLEYDDLIDVYRSTREVPGLERRMADIVTKFDSTAEKIESIKLECEELRTRKSRVRTGAAMQELLKHVNSITGVFAEVGSVYTVLEQSKEDLRYGVMLYTSKLLDLLEKLQDAMSWMQLTKDNLIKTSDYFNIIRKLVTAPRVFCISIAEINRRNAYAASFKKWSEPLVQQVTALHGAEVGRRQSYRKQLDQHFLTMLFPGLVENPPTHWGKKPRDFDTNIPQLSREYLQKLAAAAPEYADMLLHEFSVDAVPAMLLMQHSSASVAVAPAGTTSAAAAADYAVQQKAREHLESETDTEEFEKVGANEGLDCTAAEGTEVGPASLQPHSISSPHVAQEEYFTADFAQCVPDCELSHAALEEPSAAGDGAAKSRADMADTLRLEQTANAGDLLPQLLQPIADLKQELSALKGQVTGAAAEHVTIMTTVVSTITAAVASYVHRSEESIAADRTQSEEVTQHRLQDVENEVDIYLKQILDLRAQMENQSLEHNEQLQQQQASHEQLLLQTSEEKDLSETKLHEKHQQQMYKLKEEYDKERMKLSLEHEMEGLKWRDEWKLEHAGENEQLAQELEECKKKLSEEVVRLELLQQKYDYTDQVLERQYNLREQKALEEQLKKLVAKFEEERHTLLVSRTEQFEQLRDEITSVKSDHQLELEHITSENESKIAELIENHDVSFAVAQANVKKLEQDLDSYKVDAERKMQIQTEQLKQYLEVCHRAESSQKLEELQKKHDEEIAICELEASNKRKEAEKQLEEGLVTCKAESSQKLSDAQKKHEEVLATRVSEVHKELEACKSESSLKLTDLGKRNEEEKVTRVMEVRKELEAQLLEAKQQYEDEVESFRKRMKVMEGNWSTEKREMQEREQRRVEAVSKELNEQKRCEMEALRGRYQRITTATLEKSEARVSSPDDEINRLRDQLEERQKAAVQEAVRKERETQASIFEERLQNELRDNLNRERLAYSAMVDHSLREQFDSDVAEQVRIREEEISERLKQKYEAEVANKIAALKKKHEANIKIGNEQMRQTNERQTQELIERYNGEVEEKRQQFQDKLHQKQLDWNCEKEKLENDLKILIAGHLRDVWSNQETYDKERQTLQAKAHELVDDLNNRHREELTLALEESSTELLDILMKMVLCGTDDSSNSASATCSPTKDSLQKSSKWKLPKKVVELVDEFVSQLQQQRRSVLVANEAEVEEVRRTVLEEAREDRKQLQLKIQEEHKKYITEKQAEVSSLSRQLVEDKERVLEERDLVISMQQDENTRLKSLLENMEDYRSDSLRYRQELEELRRTIDSTTSAPSSLNIAAAAPSTIVFKDPIPASGDPSDPIPDSFVPGSPKDVPTHVCPRLSPTTSRASVSYSRRTSRHAMQQHVDMSTSQLEVMSASFVSQDSASTAACASFQGKGKSSITTRNHLDLHVNVGNAQPGDQVLLAWDAYHRHYRVLLTHNTLHLMDNKCRAIMGLPEDGSLTPLVAKLIKKVYCASKKPLNRFGLPLSEKFYVVEVVQPDFMKDMSLTSEPLAIRFNTYNFLQPVPMILSSSLSYNDLQIRQRAQAETLRQAVYRISANEITFNPLFDAKKHYKGKRIYETKEEGAKTSKTHKSKSRNKTKESSSGCRARDSTAKCLADTEEPCEGASALVEPLKSVDDAGHYLESHDYEHKHLKDTQNVKLGSQKSDGSQGTKEEDETEGKIEERAAAAEGRNVDDSVRTSDISRVRDTINDVPCANTEGLELRNRVDANVSRKNVESSENASDRTKPTVESDLSPAVSSREPSTETLETTASSRVAQTEKCLPKEVTQADNLGDASSAEEADETSGMCSTETEVDQVDDTGPQSVETDTQSFETVVEVQIVAQQKESVEESDESESQLS